MMQALGQVWGGIDPKAEDLVEKRTLIAAPTNFGAQLLLETWRKRAADGGFVVGRDLPSRALSSILRNLAVFEPIDNQTDFHVRLAGTGMLRRFGRDITGVRLSEVFPPQLFERRKAMLLATIHSGQPVMGDIELAHGNRKPLRFEIVALPVLAPDRVTPWVLAGLFYHDWES
ncbi:MAG TPA: PAS domain-containing protein [Rhizomicrobium sp.]|nr:PAS domain-containing protein [Rhizomicrobium sp.]